MHPFWVNDCYMTISSPLLYSLVMSRMFCIEMAAGAFTAGLLNSVVNTSYVSSLPFCSSNIIHHFFCDGAPLFKLSCSDTPAWKHLFHICWCEYGWNSAGDPRLLLLHSLLHLPYAFRGGEAQSILHMCISPDSHPPVLFHLHLHLSQTFLQLLLDSGQSGSCVLHSGHPHVESFDLQPQE